MASEKLAKAWSCSKHGTERPPQTHNVLLSFLRTAKDSRQIRSACKMSRQKARYQAYIEGLKLFAKEIELLAPVGNIDKPNPEYPWYSIASVICPLDYSFHTIVTKHPQVTKFCGFLETCFNAI
jgi:hypothetical protein